jgi:hypothetical protein
MEHFLCETRVGVALDDAERFIFIRQAFAIQADVFGELLKESDYLIKICLVIVKITVD